MNMSTALPEDISKKTLFSFVVYKPDYACRELNDLIADPDASLTAKGSKIMKDGDASTVWLTTVGQRKLVVKRYNTKGFWHGLKKSLRRSNGETSWRGSEILLSHGIATPPPVALVERRIGFVRKQVYFISEFVEGVCCSQYFLEPSQEAGSLHIMAQKILDLFGQLEKYKIAHGDMKGTNILITASGPMLTDLDYLSQHHLTSFFKYRHARDKKRFMRVWQGHSIIATMFHLLGD